MKGEPAQETGGPDCPPDGAGGAVSEGLDCDLPLEKSLAPQTDTSKIGAGKEDGGREGGQEDSDDTDEEISDDEEDIFDISYSSAQFD